MSINHVTRTEINIGARARPLIARVNRRAKRLILKVDPVSGEIFVTAPSKRALPEAIAFASERAEWIASQLDEALAAKPFQFGAHAPFEGRMHIISPATGRTPVRRACANNDRETHALLVSGGDAHVNRRVTDWMKKQARAALINRVDDYCARLGRERRAIKVRDTRTRWGSCSSDGTLSFSWRLIMAPSFVLDYVAAHECAHLVHLNHSAAFWRQVKSLGVEARPAENWLSEKGQALFSYGVTASGQTPDHDTV